MKSSIYIYKLQQKFYKKLNLLISNSLRIYYYKKFFFKLGWIFRNNYIFLNLSQILFLMRKGLRLSILHKKLNKKLTSFNFIYLIAVLLSSWYKKYNLYLIPFFQYKIFIKQLNFRFKKFLLKKKSPLKCQLIVKRWKVLNF
jgi:hypothetical protein